MPYSFLKLAILGAIGLTLTACESGNTPQLWTGKGQDQSPLFAATGLAGTYVGLDSFSNPQPNIPAQCYIETSGGSQNACLYCHSDGLANATPPIGNNQAQSGLQLAYDFAPGMNVNHWENTLFPEKLQAILTGLGVDTAAWDMNNYIRQDNWRAAYAQRGGNPLDWNQGAPGPFQLFPALDPADLPAQADGFVRSATPAHGYFNDGQGWNTGWRAINFVPYGIFTPMSGSVSGIYLRLPEKFMRDAQGRFDLATYKNNLGLLERAIQNRLDTHDPGRYFGQAGDTAVEMGRYPLGTEFVHPLHYVDVSADGSQSTFPGTRAQRVKEVRYMYKWRDFDPTQTPAGGEEEEEAPGAVLSNGAQGWIDNGAGWVLAGFIENAAGSLRPQSSEELMQCFGCHSGQGAGGGFKSGVGVTVDSTWSLPHKLGGDAGWREMDYLGYRHDPAAGPQTTPGSASLGDPVNRQSNQGEFRFFYDHVVGASLYGDMPAPVDAYLAGRIRAANGYSADWPLLDTGEPERLLQIQALRQQLMREFTTRGDYLDAQRHVAGALLYPPQATALDTARRYRQVVATQRYVYGKDVFTQTPFTFRYYRPARLAYTHANGKAYAQGEVITDRPIGVPTLITLASDGGSQYADYQPFLVYPSQYMQ